MNKISTIAQDFERQSKQQASAISESVQSAYKQHEQRLLKALEQSASTTEAAIRAQNQKLTRLVLKGWLWMLISLTLIGIVSGGLLWWTGQQIASNAAQIQQQRQTLDKLASQGGQIQLSHCGKQSQLCVAVETKQRYGGGQTTYMIVKPR